MKKEFLPITVCLAVLATGCGSPAPVQEAAKPAAPAESNAFKLYVTNEVSGDMTIIDSADYHVIATIPLGKRPRGIHASPDRQTIYVALSGSPIAGPGVDESTLPPPDHTADGIGVFDVKQRKIVRTLKAGSDPENFDLSKDGTQIYISNEDDAAVSDGRHRLRHRGEVGEGRRAARRRQGNARWQAGVGHLGRNRHHFGLRSRHGQGHQDV